MDGFANNAFPARSIGLSLIYGGAGIRTARAAGRLKKHRPRSGSPAIAAHREPRVSCGIEQTCSYLLGRKSMDGDRFEPPKCVTCRRFAQGLRQPARAGFRVLRGN